MQECISWPKKNCSGVIGSADTAELIFRELVQGAMTVTGSWLAGLI